MVFLMLKDWFQLMLHLLLKVRLQGQCLLLQAQYNFLLMPNLSKIKNSMYILYHILAQMATEKRQFDAASARAGRRRKRGRSLASAPACPTRPLAETHKWSTHPVCLHTFLARRSPNRISTTTIRAVPKGGAPRGASIGVYGAQGFRKTD